MCKCDYKINHLTSYLLMFFFNFHRLTQMNAEALFNKVESILLEYVNEIRNQVLKRFQTCLKASNEVQFLISYLLDEYNVFIQAAQNVATVITYLVCNKFSKLIKSLILLFCFRKNII